jgi:hypothetical protein
MTAARCSTTREIYCEISQQVFNIWLQPDNGRDNRVAATGFPFRNRSATATSVHRFVLLRSAQASIAALHHFRS